MTVLITGATSGIGLACAKLFAKNKYNIVITGRRIERLNSIKNQLEKEFGVVVTSLNFDIQNQVEVKNAINNLKNNNINVDVLINNAGFAIAPAGAEESSMQQAQAIFDTNFFGAVRMTRAVLPAMRQQASGLILNISSILGLLPTPFGALYSASKHALEGYSESLDHELRSQGIRVSLIEPAYTKTSLGINLLEADAKVTVYDHIREKLHQQMIKSIQQSDEPRVVANTILTVIHSRNILPRYTAGKIAKHLKNLRKFAPVKIFDKLIQRSLKI